MTPHLRSLLSALALIAGPVGGVRIVKRKVRPGEKTQEHSTKVVKDETIGGLPVHNFRADATDFVVLFAEGTSDVDIEGFCEGQCDFHGHPDANGAAFAKVHGADRLAELVKKHPQHIDILQPDEIDHALEAELESGPDASLLESWGLKAIGVENQPTTGKGVHIYVQDTGVHISHSDF